MIFAYTNIFANYFHFGIDILTHCVYNTSMKANMPCKTQRVEGLPNKLRRLRLERGMTMRELGDRIGASAQAVHQAETRGTGISKQKWYLLADVLDLDPRILETPDKQGDDIMNYIVTDRDDKDRETPIVDVFPTLSSAERFVRENGYGEIEQWEDAEDCLLPALHDYISENSGAMIPDALKRNAMSEFHGWLSKSAILSVLERY